MDEPLPQPEGDRVDLAASELVDGVAASSDPAVEARAADFRFVAAAVVDVDAVDDLRRRRHIDAALESMITAPARSSLDGTDRRRGRILAAAAAVVLVAGAGAMATGLWSAEDDVANETADSSAGSADLNADVAPAAAAGGGLGDFADVEGLVAAYRAGLPSAVTATTGAAGAGDAETGLDEGGASPVAENAPVDATASVEPSTRSVDDASVACDVGVLVATGTVGGRPAGVLDPRGDGAAEVVFLDDCSVVRPESTT